jgi:MoaA/NifB/PqqE/SkfB family radical SAM enzyme
VVYALDGRHDIDEDGLTDRQRRLLDHLVNIGIALPADGTQRLEPWQEYRSFPGIHKDNVQWSITGRCNYKCRHCFMSAPDYQGRDLSLGQCVRVLDQLAENGVYNVSVTGGEPLVSPHFYDILDEMRKRGLLLDTIYSNGELVDERLLDELERRDMHPGFHMSFDGLGWHDWLRGVEGGGEGLRLRRDEHGLPGHRRGGVPLLPERLV